MKEMKNVMVVLLSLLASTCLAEKPRPCSAPPLMTGSLLMSTQNELLFTHARFWYDAVGQRLRIKEKGTYENKTFSNDALMLYKERATFLIDADKQQCSRQSLDTPFQPMVVPNDANLVGQSVLGSFSGPGMGMIVNAWWGVKANGTGKYLTTVTEIGCVPVSTFYRTPKYGWVLVSFFDNVVGIPDPEELSPPEFCRPVEMSSDHEGRRGNEPPAAFFRSFLNGL